MSEESRVVEGVLYGMPSHLRDGMPSHLRDGMQHDQRYYEKAYLSPAGLGALINAILGW